MVVVHAVDVNGQVGAIEFNSFETYKQFVNEHGHRLQWLSVRGVLKRG
jgi:hypothetical protein